MIVPFKGVVDAIKDAFNFFHSSLRINIECAFGMLVHRWGILCKPIPMNITVKKTTSLVLCLCKLHNFCIIERERIAQPLARDVVHISNNGGISLPHDNNEGVLNYRVNEDRVDELFDGGEHFDDIRRNMRQEERNVNLPYVSMLDFIEAGNFRRPEVQQEVIE